MTQKAESETQALAMLHTKLNTSSMSTSCPKESSTDSFELTRVELVASVRQ